MNYFEHHIGDYDEATAHLSACEDGIYHRLIRKYYATEKALIADIAKLQRLVRAKTREEKIAVLSVLDEFFHLEDDGWHNDRCDSNIEKYTAGEPEREAKKANEETRLKRHREERSSLFKRLTEVGHHAPWNIAIADLREMVKRLCKEAVTPVETAAAIKPATLPATAPATPATANQPPSTTPQPPLIPSLVASATGEDASGGDPAKPKDEEFECAWLAYPKRFGGNPRNDALKCWNARRREGVQPEEMLAGVDRYNAHLAAAGKVGTEFVMQAARFFGTGKHYAEQWEVKSAAAGQPGKFTGLNKIDHTSSREAQERSIKQMGIDLSDNAADPVDF